jgi:hypothetical protein
MTLQQCKHAYITSILKNSVENYIKPLLKKSCNVIARQVFATGLNIQAIIALYNYPSFE